MYIIGPTSVPVIAQFSSSLIDRRFIPTIEPVRRIVHSQIDGKVDDCVTYPASPSIRPRDDWYPSRGRGAMVYCIYTVK